MLHIMMRSSLSHESMRGSPRYYFEKRDGSAADVRRVAPVSSGTRPGPGSGHWASHWLGTDHSQRLELKVEFLEGCDSGRLELRPCWIVKVFPIVSRVAPGARASSRTFQSRTSSHCVSDMDAPYMHAGFNCLGLNGCMHVSY